MPKYEYACKSCGEHIDVVQSFTDDALTVCPSCGGPLRKVFGNIGVVLKGSGFYKTDNRSSSGRTRGGSEGEGAKADKSEKSEKSAASDSGAGGKASEGTTSSGDSKPSSSGSSSGGSSSSGNGSSGDSKPKSKADTAAKSG